MENHHSSAAAPDTKVGSWTSDCLENKDVSMPNRSSEAVVAATIATNNNDVSKGMSVSADDKELKPHIVAELQALMPQILESDKATKVGHAIDYIKSLEKRNQELELAQQAVRESEASSSSAPPPLSSDAPDAWSVAPPLQSTVPVLVPQLIPANMSSDIPQPLQLPLATAEEAAQLQHCIITARQIGFQSWSWPNLFLSVSNNTAYISVYAPRQRGMSTNVMVLLVLNNYGIEVVTGQIVCDAVSSVFNVYARVTAMGGDNPLAALEVFQLAVSEILMWLTTS